MNKSDFPIFKTYPELVYLDNSATSQKPQAVLDALLDFYTTKNANVHRGIHKLAEAATLAFEESRKTVADYLNVRSENIIFTSGASDSLNLAAHALTDYFANKKRKTILITEFEHHSNFLPWQTLANKLNWKLDFVKLTPEFRLDLEDLKMKLTENDVAILAYAHASNVLGIVNPVSQINQIARKHSPEIVIMVDGAQYIPHGRVNLGEADAPDFYAFSGHKMLAPTGIGVLFGKTELLEQLNPSKQGGGMIAKVTKTVSTWAELPEKFEAGTPNIAGAVGLAAAVNYINKLDPGKLKAHSSDLTKYALNSFKAVPELKLFGPDSSENRLPVFSFEIKGVHAHDLAQMLDSYNIAVRAGHHCAQVLHTDVLHSPASTRASLYFYNTKEDIDKLIGALKKIIVKFNF